MYIFSLEQPLFLAAADFFYNLCFWRPPIFALLETLRSQRQGNTLRILTKTIDPQEYTFLTSILKLKLIKMKTMRLILFMR